MFRAIWRNSKEVREREKALKQQIAEKYGDEELEVTRTDLLAMIIAAYQVILPVILLFAVVLILFVWFFVNVFLK